MNMALYKCCILLLDPVLNDNTLYTATLSCGSRLTLTMLRRFSKTFTCWHMIMPHGVHIVPDLVP